MAAPTVQELIERNAAHSDSLPPAYFDALQEKQEPAAVSVCCSDARVSQEGMWSIEEAGWLFTPSTLGNQVWERRNGERAVAGSVLYPLLYTGTDVALVVGHTGCGAVTAALEAVRADSGDAPTDLETWVSELLPVVEDGLDDERVDPRAEASLVDQLVEYNVDRQIAFLSGSDEFPDGTSVYGFVYDFQGVYGDTPGRAYLVNAGGETDPDALVQHVSAAYTDHVRRLL
jgi:carbonic anhydrase